MRGKRHLMPLRASARTRAEPTLGRRMASQPRRSCSLSRSTKTLLLMPVTSNPRSAHRRLRSGNDNSEKLSDTSSAVSSKGRFLVGGTMCANMSRAKRGRCSASLAKPSVHCTAARRSRLPQIKSRTEARRLEISKWSAIMRRSAAVSSLSCSTSLASHRCNSGCTSYLCASARRWQSASSSSQASGAISSVYKKRKNHSATFGSTSSPSSSSPSGADSRMPLSPSSIRRSTGDRAARCPL
mmetsp:Transcript_43706/g.121000  ORF Transcript_43706/g.121000 Transcript_43706/m.121000 type:complete len:241 (-) Transcript_43706:748-1470(-)